MSQKPFCTKLCGPCSKQFGSDRLDFMMDDEDWKGAFGKPSWMFKSMPDNAFLGARVALAVVWMGCVSIPPPNPRPLTPFRRRAHTCHRLTAGRFALRAQIAWSIGDWVEYEGAFGYWWTKLTHLTAIWEEVYFCIAAACTAVAIHGKGVPDGRGEKTPWFVVMAWFMGAANMVVTFMVFVLFWALVYEGGPVTAISVVMHGFNFLFALIDLALNRQPFYLAHVYVPMAYSIAYIIFTVVYYAAGGTHQDGHSRYIYKALDWGRPEASGRLSGIIVLLAVPAIYIIFFVVVMSRHCLGVCVHHGTGAGKRDRVLPTSAEV